MSGIRYKRNDFMKIEKSPSIHTLLLVGALITALAMRLIRLGVWPLAHMEAEVALQALAIARSTTTRFGAHMTTVGLAGLDFYILTAGNFLARFWPGLIGALIVFVPFLFRDRIGRWPASLLSMVLAITPEMVGLSRIIGSPMNAFVFLLLGLGFLFNRKSILGGIAFALGLMSGPGFWFGGLILGISWVISDVLFEVSNVFKLPKMQESRITWSRFGISFGLTLLIVGSGFFLAPAGLSGILAGLVDFVRGFFVFEQTPFVVLPLALVAYSAGAFIFGLWGGLRGVLLRNKLDMFLFVLGGLGLLFGFIYPDSTPADLIWATLPFWVLSARVVFFAWRKPDQSRLVVILTAVLIIVVFAFMMLVLRSVITPGLSQEQQLNNFIALLGGMVFLVAIVLLVSFGWSQDVAMPGLLIGIGIVFFIATMSVSVNSTSLSSERSLELWFPEEANLSPELMKQSIDRIIGWNASGGTPVDIAVSDLDTPGMRWALQGYDPVEYVPYLPPQSQPGILITDSQGTPEISSTYRGQDLVWSREVLWEAMTPFQYLNWLITREAPIQESRIIFWVRTDLMPDEQFTP